MNIEEDVGKDVSENIELPTAGNSIVAGCRRHEDRQHQWCGREAGVICATQHVCQQARNSAIFVKS